MGHAQWNTERLLAIGRNALYFEDYVLSIQYFNQVIRIKPYMAEPYMYRAVITSYSIHYTKLYDPDFVDGASKEIRLRANYLKKEPIETIYFGGGTPSLLNSTQFQTIFDTIYDVFEILEGAEITFEANPDDS